MADTQRERLWLLVKRLAARTDAGHIVWERTVEQGTFQATFSGYLVQIYAIENVRGPDIHLRILDEDGSTIEDIVDTQFPTSQEPFPIMSGLLNNARRQAVGADRAINDLLEQLGDDDAA